MKSQSQVRTGLAVRGIGTSIVVVFVIIIGAAAWWNVGEQRASSTKGSTSSAAPSAASPNPTELLPSGVVPTREETDVREIATSRLDRMAEAAKTMGLAQTPDVLKIQSVAAIKWSDVLEHESRATAPEIGSADASRIVWLVRGEGSFLVLRTPPGREPFVGKSGYLLIDDETGIVMGMGTP